MQSDSELTALEAIHADLAGFGDRIAEMQTLQALAIRLAREMDGTTVGEDPGKTAAVAKELRTILGVLRAGAGSGSGADDELNEILAGFRVPDAPPRYAPDADAPDARSGAG